MKILVIGAGGAIGLALADVATRNGCSVISIGLNEPEFAHENYTYIVCDRRNSEEFRHLAERLTERNEFDLVVDLIPFGESDSRQVYECFSKNCGHIVIISSTLVYSIVGRRDYVITEDHPLAKLGTQGGYVDRKIESERFWHEGAFHRWSIIRPHHVIGPRTLIGCLPLHNRDSHLVERLVDGEIIKLYKSGNIDLSYIHPVDLSNLILGIANKRIAYGRAFNACFPLPIKASVYYSVLCELLKVPCKIESVSLDEVVDRCHEWILTCVDHKYSVDDLVSISDYIPMLDIKRCLIDALKHPIKLTPGYAPEIIDRISLRPYPDRNLMEVDG